MSLSNKFTICTRRYNEDNILSPCTKEKDRSQPKELWQNEDITELGEKDAELLAEMLKDSKVKINAIYTSAFFRCTKTADIINKYSNAPIIIEDRFNEFGSIEGETWAECQQRIINAIKDITNKQAQEDIVLCVTSGVNLGAFVCWSFGIEPSQNTPFLGLCSCSPIIFNYDKNTQ